MKPLSGLAALLLLPFIASVAQAHDYTVGQLVINHPWSRATPKNAPVAGGYLKITNNGSTPDRLAGGSSEVSKGFEIHEMSVEGGVMKMRELKNGIEIAPGATVELKPGSLHIMMTNLTRPLTKGERVKGSLTFEKAGKVDVEFVVEAIGGIPAGHKAGADEHKH